MDTYITALMLQNREKKGEREGEGEKQSQGWTGKNANGKGGARWIQLEEAG